MIELIYPLSFGVDHSFMQFEVFNLSDIRRRIASISVNVAKNLVFCINRHSARVVYQTEL